jgi:hypothetical protein
MMAVTRVGMEGGEVVPWGVRDLTRFVPSFRAEELETGVNIVGRKRDVGR